ncbi:MAG: hypothetical protein GYB68_16685 [Chloroflexi bacterium]|nr:hypothetical protein [Chloroflexota bacterium]
MTVLYVEKDADLMRSTFVAVGLAHLMARLFPPNSGGDARIVDMGSAYAIEVQRDGTLVDEEELMALVEAHGLPQLLPAIFKPLTATEKKRVEAGESVEEVRRKYVPIGYGGERIDYGAEKQKPQRPFEEDAIEEGATYRSPDYPVWAHLCSYFGKGSAMRTGYPLMVHVWHAHHQEHAVDLMMLVLNAYGDDFSDNQTALMMEWVESTKPALAYEDFDLFKWEGNEFDVSALSVVSPTTAQGYFREIIVPAPNTGTPTIFWLEMYLAFLGFMVVGMPYRGGGGDILTYYPLPIDINFFDLQHLINTYRAKPYVRRLYGYSGLMPRAKIDALAHISFSRAMVQHQRERLEDSWFADTRVISGMVGYYYKDISTQIPFDETVFDLPRWLPLEPDEAQLEEADDILKDHYDIVNALRGDHAEELTILSHYRAFIVDGKPRAWIDFVIAYNVHRFAKLVDSPWLPQLDLYLLRRTLMNTSDRVNYDPIFQTPGFTNIAKAIRACTVNLRYWKDVKKTQTAFRVRHGLGDDLRRQAHDADKFIEALSTFVHDYARESSSVQASTGETRPYITDDDLMEVVNLIPQYGSRVVANLLVAAGYSSDYDRKQQANDSE